MSARSELRDAAAQVALDLLRAFGVLISFSHRGAGSVSLYANFRDVGAVSNSPARGIVDEHREFTFEIPLQTGFAAPAGEAEPVSIGDKITYLSRDFFVQTIEVDDAGAMYTLTCRQRKRLSTGVG